MSIQRTLITTKDHNLQDQRGMSDVREVTIVSNSRDVPPPPPPVSQSVQILVEDGTCVKCKYVT